MNVLPALLALAVAGCSLSSSDKITDQVEASVRMPPGSDPLTHYRRYHYRDHRAIIGTYVLSSNPGREWRAKDKMILVLDDGCGVVNVIFSVKDGQVTYTDCNDAALWTELSIS